MTKPTTLESLAIIHPNAVGIDIGSREIWTAVRPDQQGETVRHLYPRPASSGRLAG